MKKIISSICLLFATLMAYGQCVNPAKIVDKDGYVNIRQGANSNSPIVGTLNSGTKVYYEYNESSSWYRISLSSNGISKGYIHKSRLSDIWTLDVAIDDKNGPLTNIRTSPGGDVKLKLPTSNWYVLRLSECKSGYWLIESIMRITDDYNEVYTSIPQTGLWIHTSCIATNMSGDGDRAYTLYDSPKRGAGTVKYYPSGCGIFVKNILDLSADKKFVKVNLSDGKTGWIVVEMLCYNPYSTCE